MRAGDVFFIALRGLAAHRLRSSLTMLGIVIGVASVISLLALGSGAQQMVAGQIQGLGSNLLWVYPGPPTEMGMRGLVGTGSSLTLEDARALMDPERAPSVAAVAPQVNTTVPVVAGGLNTTTFVRGVTPEYVQVRNYSLAEGDFFTPQQEESRARVAVLGNQVAQTLFPDGDALEQWLRVGPLRLRVIGVLESKGGAMGMEDDLVLVPITTFQAGLARQTTAGGELSLQVITVQVADRQLVEQAKEEVRAILLDRHGSSEEEDFSIISQEDVLQIVGQVTGIFTLFLGAIAGISLLVGGIGIMNIMLVSVTERTREIGIRKAVGAKRRHIMLQFLLEATFLSLAGGIVGILLGMGLSGLVSGIRMGEVALQPAVTLPVVLLAFSLSAAIGIFFGFYPASRAARLDPIQALRYE